MYTTAYPHTTSLDIFLRIRLSEGWRLTIPRPLASLCSRLRRWFTSMCPRLSFNDTVRCLNVSRLASKLMSSPMQQEMTPYMKQQSGRLQDHDAENWESYSVQNHGECLVQRFRKLATRICTDLFAISASGAPPVPLFETDCMMDGDHSSVSAHSAVCFISFQCHWHFCLIIRMIHIPYHVKRADIVRIEDGCVDLMHLIWMSFSFGHGVRS